MYLVVVNTNPHRLYKIRLSFCPVGIVWQCRQICSRKSWRLMLPAVFNTFRITIFKRRITIVALNFTYSVSFMLLYEELNGSSIGGCRVLCMEVCVFMCNL